MRIDPLRDKFRNCPICTLRKEERGGKLMR
jgi:hypothetical protein